MGTTPSLPKFLLKTNIEKLSFWHCTSASPDREPGARYSEFPWNLARQNECWGSCLGDPGRHFERSGSLYSGIFSRSLHSPHPSGKWKYLLKSSLFNKALEEAEQFLCWGCWINSNTLSCLILLWWFAFLCCEPPWSRLRRKNRCMVFFLKKNKTKQNNGWGETIDLLQGIRFAI